MSDTWTTGEDEALIKAFKKHGFNPLKIHDAAVKQANVEARELGQSWSILRPLSGVMRRLAVLHPELEKKYQDVIVKFLKGEFEQMDEYLEQGVGYFFRLKKNDL